MFKTVKGGIERALRHLHYVARNLLEALRYAVAVDGSQSDDFQDQEVESALWEV
jgi:hypothetical protein